MREDIIRIARETGVEEYGPTTMAPESYGRFADKLERFAERITAAAKAQEREACAKACEEHARLGWAARHLWPERSIYRLDKQARSIGAGECAEIIRARGEK